MSPSQGIRVRLDMSALDLPIQKHFRWIFISYDKFESIKHLKKHITKVILKKSCKISLYLDDPYILPSSEDIRVLREGDLVIVRPKSQIISQPKSSGINEEIVSEPAEKDGRIKHRKPKQLNEESSANERKIEVIESVDKKRRNKVSTCEEVETVEKSKRKKARKISLSKSCEGKKMSRNSTSVQNIKSSESSSSSDGVEPSDNIKVKKTEFPDLQAALQVKTVNGNDDDEEGTSNKRKRKRKRKPKNKNKIQVGETIEQTTIEQTTIEQTKIERPTVEQPEARKNGNKATSGNKSKSKFQTLSNPFQANRKTYFDQNEELEDQEIEYEQTYADSKPAPSKNVPDSNTVLEASQNVPDANANANANANARLPASRATATNQFAPNSGHVSCESYLLAKSGSSQTVVNGNQKSLKDDLQKLLNVAKPVRGERGPIRQISNDVWKFKSVVVENTVPQTQHHSSYTFGDISGYQTLTAPPDVGNMIGFKVLEISSNYTPQISKYFGGKIKSLVADTLTILITFDDNDAIQKIGKFEIEDEADEPKVRVNKEMTFKWSELIEPKLLSNV